MRKHRREHGSPEKVDYSPPPRPSRKRYGYDSSEYGPSPNPRVGGDVTALAFFAILAGIAGAVLGSIAFMRSGSNEDAAIAALTARVDALTAEVQALEGRGSCVSSSGLDTCSVFPLQLGGTNASEVLVVGPLRVQGDVKSTGTVYSMGADLDPDIYRIGERLALAVYIGNTSIPGGNLTVLYPLTVHNGDVTTLGDTRTDRINPVTDGTVLVVGDLALQVQIGGPSVLTHIQGTTIIDSLQMAVISPVLDSPGNTPFVIAPRNASIVLIGHVGIDTVSVGNFICPSINNVTITNVPHYAEITVPDRSHFSLHVPSTLTDSTIDFSFIGQTTTLTFPTSFGTGVTAALGLATTGTGGLVREDEPTLVAPRTDSLWLVAPSSATTTLRPSSLLASNLTLILPLSLPPFLPLPLVGDPTGQLSFAQDLTLATLNGLHIFPSDPSAFLGLFPGSGIFTQSAFNLTFLLDENMVVDLRSNGEVTLLGNNVTGTGGVIVLQTEPTLFRPRVDQLRLLSGFQDATLQASAVQTTNVTYTLPPAPPSMSGVPLVSDTNGVWTFGLDLSVFTVNSLRILPNNAWLGLASGSGLFTSGAFNLTFSLSADSTLLVPPGGGTLTVLGNAVTGTGSVIVLQNEPTLFRPRVDALRLLSGFQDTTLQASGAQTANVTYTLPSAPPDAVSNVAMVSDTTGTLSFSTSLTVATLTALNGTIDIGVAGNTTVTVGQTTSKTVLQGDLVHPSSIFGDGVDGDVVMASGAYTLLARDMYYRSLVMSSNAVIETNNFRVFVRTYLTMSGNATIRNNGVPGQPGSGTRAGGTALTATVLGTGGNGGTGSNGPGTPAAPTGVTTAIGGVGGVGGTGQGSAGGPAGTVTAPLASNGGSVVMRQLVQLTQGRDLAGTRVSGGSGGGGGGNDGAGGCAGGGGGGGSGAGVLVLFASEINLLGGFIQTNGGVGGDGTTNPGGGCTGPGGGGGGGGGGVVAVVYDTITGAVAARVTAGGGAGGAVGGGTCAGTCLPGTAGSAGTVILLRD